MKNSDNIYEIILKNKETVFPLQFLKMYSGLRGQKLSKTLNYFVCSGKIGNPRRGIYTKMNYNVEEMACSVFKFSYISLQYVLQRASVIFKDNQVITCVSYLNRKIAIDRVTYQYHRIDPLIYINRDGIEKKDGVYIATPERAFLDMLYLFGANCKFDDVKSLDKKLVEKLLPCYQSNKVEMLVNVFLNA